MHGVPMLTTLMAGSSLLLCIYPLPVRAQPKPDVFVKFGSVVTEPTFVRVPVLIGNQSNVSPAPGVDYVAALTVLTSTSQVVCETQANVPTVAPNSSRSAFHFVMGYPAPGSHLGTSGPGRPGRTVQYRVIARASPTQFCPNVDANCGNNTVTQNFQFPVGGTPTCIRLLPP